MNFINHIIVGIIVGILLFFKQTIYYYDVILFIVLSFYMDLDHFFKKNKRSIYHLRTFIQEPLAILWLGIPVGLMLFLIFKSNLYFWLSPLLFLTHVILDYICIFETYPLDPITQKIIKKEGYGIFFPIGPGWGKRKKEFPKSINELYFLCLLIPVLIIIIFNRLY